MKRDFAALGAAHFDVLVCGGGIYGAWTAYDAAMRGLKVALVEQGDWAGATSSASSKLIHGGLRYLESYDFKLVKKALTERGMLLEVAPHRVWPLRFCVPVYADSRIYRLQLKAGLMLYDLLAHIPDTNMRHRYFSNRKFAHRFAALSADGLRGGFTYADAQTDDARLVLELVAGAMAAGAVCVNYCKLTGLVEAGGKPSGATVQDRVGGGSQVVQARVLVNTAGQWLAANRESRSWCRLSKGVHLILPQLLGDEALLLTAQSDGRVFFMIPWYGRTLVGTTDTDYRGDIEHVVVEKADIDYLLREVNHFFNTRLTARDVIGSYAGLRVMRQSDATHPSDVSRDWEVRRGSDGVLYSIGGKLTSAREDAAVIADAVCTELGIDAPCKTKGRAFPWASDDFAAWSATVFDQAGRLGIDAECGKWLVRRHGKRAEGVLREVANDVALAGRIVPGLPLIYADLLFCAREEMVVHLDDLLRRRMPLLILARLDEAKVKEIAMRVAERLGWDEAREACEARAVISGLGCSQ